MNNNQNGLGFLDFITLLSFVIGVYAFIIAIQNLDENRIQTEDTKDVLRKLNEHLHHQDCILNEQTEVYLKQINGKLGGDKND